jgi:hypothetical protein
MLAEMKQNARKASRPHATLDIARDLGEMVFKAKENQGDKQLVPSATRKRSQT